jgi:hypothetical protein
MEESNRIKKKKLIMNIKLHCERSNLFFLWATVGCPFFQIADWAFSSQSDTAHIC